MAGEKLTQVQTGLLKVVQAMADTDTPQSANKIGLLTFSSGVVSEMEPTPVQDAKYDVSDVVNTMEAHGETALYDAIARAITLTDEAPGDQEATRAVVVLSDGAATTGSCLDDLVSMSAMNEAPVTKFCGHEGDVAFQDGQGFLSPGEVMGDDLIFPHANKVQVFFLGFGDADFDIGRILAQATDAEFRGSTEEDLAAVIEELSGYF